MRPWEQDEAPLNIPVYNIRQIITHPFLTLHVRGDQHLGVAGIDVEEMVEVLKREQDQHRGHIFVVDTGDYIENSLKGSIGHNYDVSIPDPDKQLALALHTQETLDKHLYGESEYKAMKPVTRRSYKHARRVGLLGNHEYRSRRTSGIWLNKQLFAGKGVLDGGIHCIINLELVNKKLKLKRVYRVYMAHRLTSSSESISYATILKNFAKKKGDVDADIYVVGHYHKRFIQSDVKYDANGRKKRVMYVVNPSPVGQSEYAIWNLYSPVQSAYYANLYLPIDPTMQPWAKV